MIDPNDEQYREWWPEEHLRFHITRRGDEKHLGDEVFYDENLGEARRLAFHAVVTTADRPNRIVWQMKKAGIRLPAYLALELHDSANGLLIKHALKIGFGGGFAKLIDPFFGVYLNESFKYALEKHCRTEWPRLAEYLNQRDF
jgi:hypothetical protein